jgi:fatty-acyl-CoA synthase
MIRFTSTIRWIEPDGRVTVHSPRDFYRHCLRAKGVFDKLPGEKFVLLWEPSVDAIAMFVGGLLANKRVCFYSIPNFKLDGDYFHLQLASLKKQGLSVLGSPRFSHLELDRTLNLPADGEVLPFSGEYSMDCMQFSSGTTGIRKRISYTGETLVKYIREYAAELGVDQKSRLACWGPHYHDLGLIYGILLPLIIGCDVMFMSNLDWVLNPQIFNDACVRYKATALLQPNFAFQFMHERCAKANLSRMVCYSGGEVVDHETCCRFEEKFTTRVYGAYGMAEAVCLITNSGDCNTHYRGVRNSGRCFAANQIKIADDEVLVKSDHLFSGYDTGEDSRIDRLGWYHSGDHGLVKDGLLYVFGRIDDSFKANGRKVIPELVEMEINKLPGIKKGRCACVCIENKRGNWEAVVLYEGEASENQLIKTAASFDVTRCIRMPNGWLVKSSSGKVSRKYSRQKFLKESESA